MHMQRFMKVLKAPVYLALALAIAALTPACKKSISSETMSEPTENAKEAVLDIFDACEIGTLAEFKTRLKFASEEVDRARAAGKPIELMDAQTHRAVLYSNHGFDRKALEDLNEIWDRYGKSEQAVQDQYRADPRLPVFYYAFGVVQSRLGNLVEAGMRLNFAHQMQSDFAEPRAQLVENASAERPPRLAAALEASKLAVDLNPRSPKVRRTHGQILAMHGEIKAAMAEFQEAVRLAPRLSVNRAARAVGWLTTGDLAKADKECDQALALDPTNVTALLCRGFILNMRNLPDKAIEALSTAISLRDDTQQRFGRAEIMNAYEERGKTYYRMGKKELALADLLKVFRPSGAHYEAEYLAGIIQIELGNRPAAVTLLDQARLDAIGTDMEKDYAFAAKSLSRGVWPPAEEEQKPLSTEEKFGMAVVGLGAFVIVGSMIGSPPPSKTIDYSRKAVCPSCNGFGTTLAVSVRNGGGTFLTQRQNCSYCNGTGSAYR